MTPPTYCDFYKWLLVEELTLTFPEQFHYGLCSIIGRIRIDPDNSIFLDNIRIPGVDRKYQLEDGDQRLKLSWSVCDQVPVYNEPVELYGEAVFFTNAHSERHAANIIPMTIKDAFNDLEDQMPISPSLFWDSIRKEFQPALKVHSYRLITQVDRLIASNLRLRVLDKLRNIEHQ